MGTTGTILARKAQRRVRLNLCSFITRHGLNQSLEENRKNIPVLILSLTPISADKIKSPNTKFTLSDTSYMASASDYRPYCVVHHNGEAASNVLLYFIYIAT